MTIILIKLCTTFACGFYQGSSEKKGLKSYNWMLNKYCIHFFYQLWYKVIGECPKNLKIRHGMLGGLVKNWGEGQGVKYVFGMDGIFHSALGWVCILKCLSVCGFVYLSVSHT